MTNIIVSCKKNEENSGIDFEISFGQQGDPSNEEKAAAIYLMPFVKNAVEVALREAEEKAKEQNKPSISETVDNGPKIITLD